MRQRSSYPKPFKAQVVQEHLQPSATASSVAISHGINANVIRKWLPLHRDQPPAALPAQRQTGGGDREPDPIGADEWA
ncbi:transposase [Pseudomonas sp. FME51]|uniref:transposase n=1 Tax=Pseudomonas sp. FME51 TaxID=2742609 RepID=UPI00186840F0|nr:transposase [Pseudomonas sp. FME51]